MFVMIGQAAAVAVVLLRSNDSVSGLEVTHPAKQCVNTSHDRPSFQQSKLAALKGKSDAHNPK